MTYAQRAAKIDANTTYNHEQQALFISRSLKADDCETSEGLFADVIMVIMFVFRSLCALGLLCFFTWSRKQ